MAAGTNVKLRIWRISTPTDDSIGGAVNVESLEYDNIYAREEEVKAEMVLLQQGLEIERPIMVHVYKPLLIYERDEVEIMAPTNHRYYLKRCRIVDVQSSSLHPSDHRSHLRLTLRRKEYSHALQ